MASGGSALVGRPGGIQAKPASLAKACEQYKSGNVGWSYCCVKAISQKIAEREILVGTLDTSPPKRFKAIGDNAEPMDSHPILDLLADPCPLLARWSLLYMTVANLEITGRAHWRITEDNGQPQLWPLPSSWVTPKNLWRTSWEVRPTYMAESFTVAGDDMVYFALPDPSDPFGCLSPLQSQSPAVATDEQIQIVQYRHFKNGIFPGVMIRAGRLPNMAGTSEGPRPVLTPNQRRELTDAIKKNYQGVANTAGRNQCPAHAIGVEIAAVGLTDEVAEAPGRTDAHVTGRVNPQRRVPRSRPASAEDACLVAVGQRRVEPPVQPWFYSSTLVLGIFGR